MTNTLLSPCSPPFYIISIQNVLKCHLRVFQPSFASFAFLPHSPALQHRTQPSRCQQGSFQYWAWQEEVGRPAHADCFSTEMEAHCSWSDGRHTAPQQWLHCTYLHESVTMGYTPATTAKGCDCPTSSPAAALSIAAPAPNTPGHRLPSREILEGSQGCVKLKGQ